MISLHWDSLSHTSSPRRPDHAETRDSGQARRIVQFIAATYDGTAFPFDWFELRAVIDRWILRPPADE